MVHIKSILKIFEFEQTHRRVNFLKIWRRIFYSCPFATSTECHIEQSDEKYRKVFWLNWGFWHRFLFGVLLIGNENIQGVL